MSMSESEFVFALACAVSAVVRKDEGTEKDHAVRQHLCEANGDPRAYEMTQLVCKLALCDANQSMSLYAYSFARRAWELYNGQVEQITAQGSLKVERVATPVH